MNKLDKEIVVTLSGHDLLIINNAINEIVHGPDAIEEPEFQTRVGRNISTAKELLIKIGSILSTRFG